MATHERTCSSGTELSLDGFETAADTEVSLNCMVRDTIDYFVVSQSSGDQLHSIRSQALVNSDNEESTDDEKLDKLMTVDDMSKLQIASYSHDKLNELTDKSPQARPLTQSIGRSSSSSDVAMMNDRLNMSRKLWREHSLSFNQGAYELEHDANYRTPVKDIKMNSGANEMLNDSAGCDTQREHSNYYRCIKHDQLKQEKTSIEAQSSYSTHHISGDQKDLFQISKDNEENQLKHPSTVSITINDFSTQKMSSKNSQSTSAVDALLEVHAETENLRLEDLSTASAPLTLDVDQLIIASNRLSVDNMHRRSETMVASLSDNCLQSTNKMTVDQRKIHERLKSWKKTNRINSDYRENPFDYNIHTIDLEKLETEQQFKTKEEFKSSLDLRTIATHQQETSKSNNTGFEQQQQLMQNYAAHLSKLYERNQCQMDNNSDFRTLLYNIICCLLIQDQQVLGTPSVTKMLHVIRSHLESTSKVYETASQSLSNINDLLQQQHQLTTQQVVCQESNREGSIGSTSNTSSTGSSSANITHLPKEFSSSYVQADQNNFLQPPSASLPKRRGKPTDFRRVSSVSYNDEQLINDLCEHPVSESKGVGGKGEDESPWKYDELCKECKQYSTTSQSSLDNKSSSELVNDSGISGFIDGTSSGKRNENLIKKRCNYMKKRFSLGSSNEYLTSKANPSSAYFLSSFDHFKDSYENDQTSFYDESCSVLDLGDKYEKGGPTTQVAVDVAGRRAELEWTLNRLINFELKYTWLTSKDTLRRAIRKIGVPNEIRGKVWLILIEQIIGEKYDALKLLNEADKTIGELTFHCEDEETQSILKQIDLDVNRTMPGHKLFTDGAEGGIKLRRILVAYSIHINKAIAYCQGFNFIVALLLSVFEGDEQRALRGFVCIVDHIFPSKFYFDHYLTGARADQFLLADFICDQLIKNPTSAERKMVEGVTSSITLNWFISLFHGAVPTLTRLTILDHFMLEGVKALFRFTMAILYLAFQVTPPSSCEVFTTIRNTAKDMYDIKLLLSIVEQIKLPKDSYFAIRRSFYMVQSSFNSDQFYMQSLSNDANRQLVSTKPLSVQQIPDTKLPAMSLIASATLSGHGNQQFYGPNGSFGKSSSGPRVCLSSDKTKVCIQNLGKMGRSHIKVIDANVRANERALISPLRNCLVIGISNCGKTIIVARQASKRNFKIFHEQDLMFHVHELSAEIFDGFYLEESKIALIMTHPGEIFKIDVSKCVQKNFLYSTETLMLKDGQPIKENEKLKLRLTSFDTLTNLLWIYVECEDMSNNSHKDHNREKRSTKGTPKGCTGSTSRMRSNNPFSDNFMDTLPQGQDSNRNNYQRKIIIIDVVSFDIFSAFTLHHTFGDVLNMRTSLVAFCQLGNPMSNQFSSRIVRIGPTGYYEHLLSFSDVVDFLISVPDACRNKHQEEMQKVPLANQRYSSIKRLLPRSISLNQQEEESDNYATPTNNLDDNKCNTSTAGTLTKYYRSLMRRHSILTNEAGLMDAVGTEELSSNANSATNTSDCSKGIERCSTSSVKHPMNNHRKKISAEKNHSLLDSYLSDIENKLESHYIPVNMVFIFRNGKIALFEFTESYAIHTRESQLDRYDYSKVVEVSKKGQDFIITILTMFDRLIKVVI